MRLFWICLLLLAGLSLAAAALPQLLQPGGGITGGGARAASASLRLSGTLDGWSTGVSQGGGLRLEGGIASALNAPPPPNSAHRAWLRAQ